jgi:hypothetical protein
MGRTGSEGACEPWGDLGRGRLRLEVRHDSVQRRHSGWEFQRGPYLQDVISIPSPRAD